MTYVESETVTGTQFIELTSKRPSKQSKPRKSHTNTIMTTFDWADDRYFRKVNRSQPKTVTYYCEYA